MRDGHSLVPLDDGALDATEGEADGRVPGLRRLFDEVVDRVAELGVLTDVGVGLRAHRNGEAVSNQTGMGGNVLKVKGKE